MPRQVTHSSHANKTDLSNMIRVNTDSLNKALTDTNTDIGALRQEIEILKAKVAKLEQSNG